MNTVVISYSKGTALLHSIEAGVLAKKFRVRIPKTDLKGRCGLCGMTDNLIPLDASANFTEYHLLRGNNLCPHCFVVIKAKPFYFNHDAFIVRNKKSKLDIRCSYKIEENGFGLYLFKRNRKTRDKVMPKIDAFLKKNKGMLYSLVLMPFSTKNKHMMLKSNIKVS